MKFTPEVVAALKVLRDNAESDFERHRIDVLERDLTAPPTVEIVDENHQRFNGVTYTKSDRNGHFSRGFLLHRDVWAYYNGNIPEGHVIHHIDHNPLNNIAVNLQCLSFEDHKKKHDKRPLTVSNICKNCGKEFFSSYSKDFCSDACRVCASANQNGQQEFKICPVCKKAFSPWRRSNTEQVCCSHFCATTYMHMKRKSEVEKTPRFCKNCGKEIPRGESHGGQFCSQSCRGQYRQKTEVEQRVCSECGKTFSCYKYSKTTFCSRRCANISNGKRKRKS